MPEEKKVKKIYKWELIPSRPVGRPKRLGGWIL
jgi:hypothetical protein